MSRRICPLLVALLLLPSVSQARSDGAPTTSLGMADAVSASAVGVNALYFNPAGMTLARQYVVEGNYVYNDHTGGHGMTAAAVDSKTNPVIGMGVAYTRIDSNLGDLKRKGNGIRGALSGGQSTDGFGFHLGVGVNYGNLTIGQADLNATQEQELIDDGQPVPSVDDVEFTTVDAGLIIQIVPSIRLAAVVRNILDTVDGVRPRQPDELPMEVSAGCALGFQHFELTFDADMDMETDPTQTLTHYKVGTQFLLGGSVVVRGGFSSDEHDGHERLAFGLGYVDRVVAVDLGVRATVDVEDEFDAGISFRYFMP